jgi:hypothetical protein
MFGLFKQKVNAKDFGYCIVDVEREIIAVEAGRSLGMRFDDFDATDGWSKFLEYKGMSIPIQKLHFRLFMHCGVQAAGTQFEANTRRAITQGAIAGFANKPDGYDFETTYATLEAIYGGQHKFDQRVASLSNRGSQIHFLPNGNAGVSNAKYLIESFVIPNMKNSEAFIDDFQSYSSTVCATVGTVQRAINQLLSTMKIT